jgi:RHS repeat-associated protein
VSTPLRRYYRGHNLVAMRDEVTPSTRYYHFDHQGTTQCLTDQSGAVTDRFASDAWGVEVKRTGSSINRQWYIGNWGYYRQSERMIDYVRIRHCANATGRWLAVDPVRGGKAYKYVRNRPSVLLDPSGMFGCRVTSTRIMQNDTYCASPKLPWFPLGFWYVDVLTTRLFRAEAEIECTFDIQDPRHKDCKCPDPGFRWCQGYSGTIIDHAGYPNQKKLVSILPGEWCPDEANYPRLQHGPYPITGGNCVKSPWGVSKSSTSGPTLISTIIQGSTLLCSYRTCLWDTPGRSVYNGNGNCFEDIDESEIDYQRIPKSWAPYAMNFRFQSWICDDVTKGSLAPGATKLNWTFEVFDGGTAQQSCSP